jgi:hypothetical protein
MKKFLALFVACAVTMAIALPATAQMKFKDVPDSHWAASAVYDLVKLGVTQGYPDGTFRGKRNISRYETAILISKLAKAVGASSDVKRKLDALQADVAALKRRPAGGGMGLSGAYLASWKAGNLLTEKGGIRGKAASYRLKLSSAQDLGNGADVIINLDTMDYGYMDDGATITGGILTTQLLDIESNLNLDLAALGLVDPVALKVTYGPGNKVHAADPTGSFPSEVGVTYMRPDTAIIGSTQILGLDVSGGYVAEAKDSDGKVDVGVLTSTVGMDFQGVPLVNTLRVDLTGDYVSTGVLSSDTRDIRASIGLAAPLGEKVKASGTIGIGASETKSWMVKGAVELDDVLDTGTVAVVRVSKVGSKFISSNALLGAAEWDYAGFDTFNRALTPGTVNLGGEVVQNVSDDVKLVGKGEVRLNGDYQYKAPNGALTAQGGVSYAVAPNTTLDATYRIFQSKATNDTSDIAALGLLYEF